MVSSDSTITLERHTRKVTLTDGPIISTKKSKLHKKQTFQVTELMMNWFGEGDPEHVVAHGFYLSKHGLTVRCKRIYHYSDLPKWIKDALNG
jgi:hypothetical protein